MEVPFSLSQQLVHGMCNYLNYMFIFYAKIVKVNFLQGSSYTRKRHDMVFCNWNICVIYLWYMTV